MFTVKKLYKSRIRRRKSTRDHPQKEEKITQEDQANSR
jgi:hypothetical protein